MINHIANILTALVALLHFYFLILEMFLWNTPKGRKIFGNSEEKAKVTKILAANQGLYNGFLSAGLFYGLCLKSPEVAFQFKGFFLVCVFIAGIYGAFSVSKRIFFIQALPAILALIFLWLGLLAL